MSYPEPYSICPYKKTMFCVWFQLRYHMWICIYPFIKLTNRLAKWSFKKGLDDV